MKQVAAQAGMDIQPRLKTVDDIEFDEVCQNAEKLAAAMQELLTRARAVEKVRSFTFLPCPWFRKQFSKRWPL